MKSNALRYVLLVMLQRMLIYLIGPLVSRVTHGESPRNEKW